ncbi:MAG: pilus assembly protein PilM, partial [Candidatus Omnitrophica bacterium]|nr:pilus assembly protein PilM [Candidatus Omnitrophota bacterium]
MAVTEVGLYIGADFADLVVMSFLKGKPQIIKTARSPLFEGQTAGISRVFDAAGQKRSNVNTCLPQGEIMLRRFIMPYLIPQERMTAVKFEAQKYIPFKLDDVISDFYVTSENKVAMSMDVLFAAANKQATEKNLQVFKDLSITLNVLDIMPVALIRVMSLSDKWGSRQESKAVVHVEKDSRGSIIIIKDDQPYLVREIAPSSSKEVFFTNMLNNLRLSVDYFKRETKETGIEKILICGEGDLAGAELYLKENASVDRVEVLELKDEIAGLNELSRKQLIAAGLAMSGFEKPKPKINLLTRVPKAGMPRQIRDYKPLIIE